VLSASDGRCDAVLGVVAARRPGLMAGVAWAQDLARRHLADVLLRRWAHQVDESNRCAVSANDAAPELGTHRAVVPLLSCDSARVVRMDWWIS